MLSFELQIFRRDCECLQCAAIGHRQRLIRGRYCLLPYWSNLYFSKNASISLYLWKLGKLPEAYIHCGRSSWLICWFFWIHFIINWSYNWTGTVPALVANGKHLIKYFLHWWCACKIIILLKVSENAVLFTSYGVCQKIVANAIGCSSVKQMSPLANATGLTWQLTDDQVTIFNLLAGSFAAVFAALVLCPTGLFPILQYWPARSKTV